MKNCTRLSDEQWALIAPHLPLPAKTGRPRADDRRTLEAILHVLRSALPLERPTRGVWRRFYDRLVTPEALGGRRHVGVPVARSARSTPGS